MQTFKFSKMHGAGNDYIYVNCFEEKVENINETAKAVSDRHSTITTDIIVDITFFIHVSSFFHKK